MNLEETTLEQTYVFKGRIINLRKDQAKLPNGNVSGREVVEHPGGVAILAINEKKEGLFVRQFRYPYKKVILEIPAGKLEWGEDPLEAGKRELREETGAMAENYRSLGELYPTPGYCSEIIHLYLATKLSFTEMQPDEDEFLEPVWIPLEEVLSMILKNELPDSKTQVAVMKAMQLLK